MKSCHHKRHDGNLVATREAGRGHLNCRCEFPHVAASFQLADSTRWKSCRHKRHDGILSPRETRFHPVATRNHDTMKSCHPAGIDCSLCRGPFARDVSARRSWLKAPRTPCLMHEERRSSFSPPLVDEVGHQRRPARLVACPQASGCVAVEVFVEEQLVTPLRVVAEAGCIAPHGPVA